MYFQFRSSIYTFVAAAILAASSFLGSPAHADIISISDQKLSQCGSGGIVCDGSRALSLTAIVNGFVQLAIADSQTPEFVVVNDTGATVRISRSIILGHLHQTPI